MTNDPMDAELPVRLVGRREFLRRAAAAAAPGAALGLIGGRHAAGSAALDRDDGASPRVFAYVGCFSGEDRRTHGEGISVYRVGSEPGAWSLVQVLRDQTSPAFLVCDPKRLLLFAVNSSIGRVSSYKIDARSGEIALLNQAGSGGVHPAHLALDPTGRFLVVANYGSGSVAVLPVLPDGTIGAHTHLVTLQGTLGPHRTEQAEPHPHQCRFDPSGRHVAVPDKGLDRVFVFRLDPGAGRLQAVDPPSVATRAGAGPRHMDFHPTAPYAYVVNELDSTVAVFRVDTGRGGLTPIQIVPSLPSSFTGPNTGAGIEVSRTGRFVYASNRGHDSLAVFGIDPRDGTLRPRGWTQTGGRMPRFFCFDWSGRMIYAANQASDTIVAFLVDPGTGALKRTGRPLSTGTPTAVAFHRVL